jgi:initiation factor 1A
MTETPHESAGGPFGERDPRAFWPRLRPEDRELYLRGLEPEGVVESVFAAGRMSVRCEDGRVRVCRIPKSLGVFGHPRVREGDAVLVKPWPVEGEERGTVVAIRRRARALGGGR